MPVAARNLPLPRVSIIVPAYNAAAYLRQALDTVLSDADSHTYQLIVVDDGSTDDTADIVASYGEQITYCYQPNQGSAAARNTGLALAQAAYILFLDADDYRLPGYLAQQCHLLDRQPEWGAVHSGWRVVDEAGNPLADVQPWTTLETLDLAAWLLWKPVFFGAMLFRRDWLLRVGGLDAALRQAHDVDLLWRLALAGCQVGWLHQITVCYRQHERNTTRNGRVQVQSIDQLLHKFFQRSDLPAAARTLEEQIRYYTHLWQAWYLFRTDNWDLLPDYLERAQQFTNDRDPAQTCFFWTAQFAYWSRTQAYPAQPLPAALWPYFQAALKFSMPVWRLLYPTLIWCAEQIASHPDHPYLVPYRFWFFWQTAVSTLDFSPQTAATWWCHSWYYYSRQDWADARQNLAHALVHLPPLTPAQWLALIQTALISSPDPVGPETVAHLWQDLVRQGHLQANQRLNVRLHLSGLAQAVLKRQGQTAVAHLSAALRRSLHPWAVYHWLAFGWASLQYLWQTRSR